MAKVFDKRGKDCFGLQRVHFAVILREQRRNRRANLCCLLLVDLQVLPDRIPRGMRDHLR
jgi:hypothetical protein